MAERATFERPAWIWTWIAASLPFLGFWLTGLFDLDEGFYGAVVREMLVSGDWIVPRYNGEPWLEKPILMYWLAAPLTAIFGDAVGPRLGSVLCSLGTMALCAWFTRRHFDDFVARRVVLVLATSLLFAIVGRLLLADALMVMLQTAAVLFWLESVLGHPRWRWASGGAIGLAMLAKGPVSLAFLVVVMALGWGLFPAWRPRMRGGWLGFVVALAASLSIWVVPIMQRAPELFIQEFLWRQNIQRLLGGDQAHASAPWQILLYYPLILFFLAAPWWWHALLQMRQPTNLEAGRFIERQWMHWGLVVFVFFSLGGSKLPHYILPVVVPLALLAAVRLGSFDRLKPHPVAGVALTMGGALLASWLVNGLQLLQYHNTGQALAHDLVRHARARGGELVVYQMVRNPESRGGPKGQGAPSVNFYLGRPPTPIESLDRLLERPVPFLVLTRVDRLSTPDFDTAQSRGLQFVRLRQIQTNEPFELYWVGPKDAYVEAPGDRHKPPTANRRIHDHGPAP